jgi:enoyl-CoA hydratase/carnithine racemase
MEYEDIELIRGEGIAFIYLNRPKVLNALSETMMVELVHALKETKEDNNIRVMILSGRGHCLFAASGRPELATQRATDRNLRKDR